MLVEELVWQVPVRDGFDLDRLRNFLLGKSFFFDESVNILRLDFFLRFNDCLDAFLLENSQTHFEQLEFPL